MALAVAAGVVLAACADDPDDATTTTTATSAPTTTGAGAATSGPATSGQSTSAPATSDVPAEIQAIMDQPRYADATWSLLVTDVETGETFYSLNADQHVVHRVDAQAVLGRAGPATRSAPITATRRRCTASARSAPTAR